MAKGTASHVPYSSLETKIKLCVENKEALTPGAAEIITDISVRKPTTLSAKQASIINESYDRAKAHATEMSRRKAS